MKKLTLGMVMMTTVLMTSETMAIGMPKIKKPSAMTLPGVKDNSQEEMIMSLMGSSSSIQQREELHTEELSLFMEDGTYKARDNASGDEVVITDEAIECLINEDNEGFMTEMLMVNAMNVLGL